ncbi:3'-5' exonuclease [Delftia lacustris]|uniref:3'-5' exonuclease n=1 Tax=Delftia TaxID=80865 RepID=UPI002D77370E|nr:3'-5' exonuclease [Delftia lacustris]
MVYLAYLILAALACYVFLRIRKSKRKFSESGQIIDHKDAPAITDEVAGCDQHSDNGIPQNSLESSQCDSPEQVIKDTKREEVAFIDVETTGLDPSKDRIIEVALLVLPIGVSCMVEGYSKLANPGIPIPARITDLTGITDAMVKDERPVGEVVRELLDAIGDRPVAAYNASFDTSFLKEEAKRINRIFENETVCLMQYVKNKHPDLRRYRLGDVCDAFGIFDTEAEKQGFSEHRALYDAERALRLFLAISSGLLPSPPSPRSSDREVDFENLEKYHLLRNKAKGLSILGKEKEAENLDEAISIHLKAIKLAIDAGRVEIYKNTADWSGPSMTADIGEISCLDRLTICLCKRKRASEAAAAADEYFSVFPKQAELKVANAIRARIQKAAAKA